MSLSGSSTLRPLPMLIKARGIRIARTQENQLTAYFVDEDDNLVMTMEPTEVFDGEELKIDFGSTLVMLKENLPDLEVVY